MGNRFNEPRLMGNCENCYYATDVSLMHPWLVDKGESYNCHRYPETVEKKRGDYCGEFAWKHMNANDEPRGDSE